MMIMAVSMIPNVVIQREKLRVFMDEMDVPTKPRAQYDNWAYGILRSNHSDGYQILAFMIPVMICFIGGIVWISSQFPSSNWPPFLIGMLAIHMVPILLRLVIVRWTTGKIIDRNKQD